MKTFGIFEAKTKLSDICDEVARTGLPVLVTRRGMALVRIEPVQDQRMSVKERLALVQTAIADLPKVEADSFEGLLVDYVEKRKGLAIIRGLRAVSDFEFEFQLALMNRKLNERVETIFMMPKATYTFLSSRIVKEIASLGGNVDCFVPEHVRKALAQKLRK